MATPEWKETWRPASFRGVQFHVDVGNHVGGRRGMDFEFPKQDEPYFEDLGRRGAKRAVTGYVLGSDYVRRAQELQDALNAEGAGMLIHPTMRPLRAVCTIFTRSERRLEGGIATFDMQFTEAGSVMASRITQDTLGALSNMATSAASSAISALAKQLNLPG
jgi:prophage DNA circulation protein